jgi:hypothetical protein
MIKSLNDLDARPADDPTHSTGAMTTDGCRPTLCALGAAPHAHCTCGLAMPAGATLCDLCRAEGLQPKPLTSADHGIEWDGRRYPSRRLNRPLNIPARRYDDLLLAILGPLPDRNAREAA